jgi:membrane protein YqaA with SNARE-associated domain
MAEAGKAPPLATGFAALPCHERRSLNYWAWFIPFALVMVPLAAWGVSNLHVTGWTRDALLTSVQKVDPLARLAIVFSYCSVACTFLPLPTTALVCAAALLDGQHLSPLLLATVLATVCTVGTCAANLHDYYLLTALYRYGRVRKVRQKKLYERFARWFRRSPFWTLVAASFIPIPVDVVRLMAISEGYSRVRFTAASFIGRWPRYFLLALFTKQFNLGWQAVLAVLAITAILALSRGVPKLIQILRGTKHKEETPA